MAATDKRSDAIKITTLTMVCENEVMKGVLDAFGMDIKVKRAAKGHFQTTVIKHMDSI